MLLQQLLVVSLLAGSPSVDSDLAQRFADLALHCVHREYPNKIAHVLQSDGDARPSPNRVPAAALHSTPCRPALSVGCDLSWV